MHLVALVERPDHVCCRYRITAFRPWLEGAGHTLELLPWPKHWWSRLRITAALRHADLVILQRRLLAPWQLYLVRCAAPRLVYDFDDAVYLRDSYSPRGLYSVRRLHRFMATVETADAILAGNRMLAQEAERWSLPGHVHQVPTCVDPTRYPLARHERRGAGVRMVWVGSASTLRGLEEQRPLLEALGRAVQGVQLKLVCDRFLALDDLEVLPCRWAEETEAQEIADADIGISWVPDDNWSRGKCGLKVLQYMAAGLPVVANPIGVQETMVQDGVTGFLAHTESEWCTAIRRLAADPDLRQRMGQAGRAKVEAEYSVSVAAARWLEVLQGLVRSPKKQDAA